MKHLGMRRIRGASAVEPGASARGVPVKADGTTWRRRVTAKQLLVIEGLVPGVIMDGRPYISWNIAAAMGSSFRGGARFAEPRLVMFAPNLKKSKV